MLLLLLLGTAAAASLRYDQTQTGDTNIHLQIKNVEVLALLDDSAAGEYEYDYSDFTEKPLKPPKPGAVSNYNATTVLPIEDSNLTVTSSTPDQAPSGNSTEAASSSEAKPEILEPILSSTPAAAEETTSSSTTTKKTRRCGAGFYRDTLGRCRRIRRPHLQMGVNAGRAKSTEGATAA